MSEVDFTAILSKQVGSAPQPKPLPDGTYTGVIEGLPTSRPVKTKEGEKPVLTVTVGIGEAMDDVDPEALEAAGGLMKANGERKTIRSDFWLDENSLWVFDRFLESCGFGADSGKTYQEVLEELPGKEVTINIEQETYTAKGGGERTAIRVKRIFGSEGAAA